MFDFLVVKRTLALKGSSSVPIAESEPAFTQALNDMGATDLGNPDRQYLNPFAILETGKKGFRPTKYRSNGTNSTISGVPWQKVISLTDDKPRKASLANGHEGALAKLALYTNTKKPMPSLAEAAVWFFRGKDIEPIVAAAKDDDEAVRLITDSFVHDLQLTPGEIGALFSTSTTIVSMFEGSDFVAEKPDPSAYLTASGDQSGAADAGAHSEVSADLVAALAAKNFVILTGPSGTGKSRAALKLADALQLHYEGRTDSSIYELVTVGPDWTSPKKLLGFKTPFGKERTLANGEKSYESYEVPNTLRLILRACHPDAADTPHFLIFDEMNLSHVERYFAPFLSLMEASGILDAESGISLIGADDLKVIADVLAADNPASPEAKAAAALLASGYELILPPNLFFVGTVNVDETTYMFSPKVLDRAHVIELVADRPSAFLSADPKAAASGTVGIDVADQLLRRAIEARESQLYSVSNPLTILDGLADSEFSGQEIEAIKKHTLTTLDGCFDLLGPVGFPFGYRVTKEVFIYIVNWISLSVINGGSKSEAFANWQQALDKAVLQKVLPKIHGNRRALGNCLMALSAFLGGGDGKSSPSASYTLGLGTRVEIVPINKLPTSAGVASFPKSRAKLDMMHERLNATGYISFVS